MKSLSCTASNCRIAAFVLPLGNFYRVGLPRVSLTAPPESTQLLRLFSQVPPAVSRSENPAVWPGW